ncbi:unnamed protein product [Sphagnum troendelagicum]|uniref:Uncharacterized protein n=1 Tax=Sphagnum troendelagicum TaxID=128251 RepID=A0ABP0TFB4_9BRYO
MNPCSDLPISSNLNIQWFNNVQHTLMMMLKVLHLCIFLEQSTNGSIAKHFDDIHIMRLCIVLGILQNSSDCNTL